MYFFSGVCTCSMYWSTAPGLPDSDTLRSPISMRGGLTSPNTSKNCCTEAKPGAAWPFGIGYVQPLASYHWRTAPLSNSWAASFGDALAFFARSRGVAAPARTPCGNG